MKHLSKLAALATLSVALIGLSAPAWSAPVFCAAESATLNYMSVDESQVSACLASGVGNIGQSAQNDPFLLGPAGAGWTNVSDGADLSFTQDGNTGTWSFDSSMWEGNDSLAIGFKFGTGNLPDEWFVYSLQDLVSSGTWEFFNIGGTGGGLSHLVLYASGDGTSVPEPGTLALLGLGLAGLGFAKRRRRKA
jgi:hypothetical protein